MAVRSTATFDAAPIPGDVPIRTCVGCRRRAAATELLRVVVMPAASSAAASPDDCDVATLVVPDPRKRAAGRGAWVHRELGCVEQAQRRRAFGRALRVPGVVDPAPVIAYVAQLVGHQVEQNAARDHESENKSYGHSMKRQQ